MTKFLDQEIQRALRQPRNSTHPPSPTWRDNLKKPRLGKPRAANNRLYVVVVFSLRINRKIPKKNTKMQMT